MSESLADSSKQISIKDTSENSQFVLTRIDYYKLGLQVLVIGASTIVLIVVLAIAKRTPRST